VTKPDHVVFRPLELVSGKNLEEFGEVGQKRLKLL
jgi:hypothetical protein